MRAGMSPERVLQLALDAGLEAMREEVEPKVSTFPGEVPTVLDGQMGIEEI